MKKLLPVFLLFFLPILSVRADPPTLHPKLKISSRGYGFLPGYQRGKYTFFELGGEYHWRKVKLKNPTVFSIGGNMEYNFKHNVLGYKFGGWIKKGRINFTYGLNICYFTDFEGHRLGGGPAIGFRLIGFHLVNGYNFTFGSHELEHFNRLYVSIRYYIPLENKIKFKKKNKNNNSGGLFKKE